MQLLAELKRRNVIRMAGLYLVGARLVVQIAETLLALRCEPRFQAMVARMKSRDPRAATVCKA